MLQKPAPGTYDRKYSLSVAVLQPTRQVPRSAAALVAQVAWEETLAVALAVANTTLMLEHAIYSVISPEGCSSILWRSSDHADQAAEALKLTAQDMEKFKIIDEIIPEPIGGAHRDPIITIKSIGDVIEKRLNELMVLSKDELLKLKEKKYLEIG